MKNLKYFLGSGPAFHTSTPACIDKPIGASPNSKILKDYKATLFEQTEIEMDTAIGHALGDASVDRKNNTTRLKFEWGNKEYAEHVKGVFDRWVITEEIREQTRVSRAGTSVTTWCFQTISHSSFNPIADLFLDASGKRSIPAPYSLVINYLSARGLAYWFMDDGGKLRYEAAAVNQGYEFHTQSFSHETVAQQAQGLQDKFGVSATVKVKRGQPSIAIPVTETGKVTRIIEPFMADCMRYKLPKSRN